MADGPVYRPLGVFKYTCDATTAKALSSPDSGTAPPTGAARCTLSCETNSARYRDDGTAPTSSSGVPLIKDMPAVPYEGDLSALKLIGQSANSIVWVAFYSQSRQGV